MEQGLERVCSRQRVSVCLKADANASIDVPVWRKICPVEAGATEKDNGRGKWQKNSVRKNKYNL